jgi:hypothetical protein
MTALSESGEFLLRLSEFHYRGYSEYSADVIAVFTTGQKAHYETITATGIDTLWLELKARGYLLCGK